MSAQVSTLACFGEVVLRLGVPRGEAPLARARFEAYPGGAEVNVAVALAGLGHPTRMISALPSGPIGDAVMAGLRREGVDVSAIARREGRQGLYYLVPGGPVSAAQVVYDREGSSFCMMPASEWDWTTLLDGCNWLHISGVTPALGRESAEAARAAMRAAHVAGLTVSFDGNWRGRLWERWDGDPVSILTGLVEEADILFGNHRDASLLLGCDLKGDGPERRREAALALFSRFPRLSLIASTARKVVDPQCHTVIARLDTRQEAFQSESVTIAPIIDRIGTGDAFAAGIIDGLRRNTSYEDALKTGLALAAIKHGLAGDSATISRAMLSSADFTHADVRR